MASCWSASRRALLLATVAREAAAVAVAQGVRLPYPDPVVAVETIARRTAANRSSMLQDVARGAPTEIDAICGAIVEAGERTGVANPGQSYPLAAGESLISRAEQMNQMILYTQRQETVMQTVSTLPELRAARAGLPEPVGLVPTMGFLHEGHLSLVRMARAQCASVVVSIFVNPTQFGPSEDLAAYPRDLPRDLDLLESEGVDLVWMPTPEIMYPPGYQTWVTVEDVTQPLEGAMRPGHFRGVATVVAKLFNAVQPQKAYFGQKDAQQVAVVRQMAAI